MLFSLASLMNSPFTFQGDQHARDPICCFYLGPSQGPILGQEGDPPVLLPAFGTPQCPRDAEET